MTDKTIPAPTQYKVIHGTDKYGLDHDSFHRPDGTVVAEIISKRRGGVPTVCLVAIEDELNLLNAARAAAEERAAKAEKETAGLRAEARRISDGIKAPENNNRTVWIGPAETACDALDRIATDAPQEDEA